MKKGLVATESTFLMFKSTTHGLGKHQYKHAKISWDSP